MLALVFSENGIHSSSTIPALRQQFWMCCGSTDCHMWLMCRIPRRTDGFRCCNGDLGSRTGAGSSGSLSMSSGMKFKLCRIVKEVGGNPKDHLIWISAYMIYIWLIHIRVGYMWERKPLQQRRVPHRASAHLTNTPFSAQWYCAAPHPLQLVSELVGSNPVSCSPPS